MLENFGYHAKENAGVDIMHDVSVILVNILYILSVSEHNKCCPKSTFDVFKFNSLCSY